MTTIENSTKRLQSSSGQTLDYATKNYGIRQFFYEADVRNAGSNKLLNKFAKDYEITDLEVEKLTTYSGKELELQGHILALKG